MAVLIVFLLGIANFALHRAVLASRRQWFGHLLYGRLSLALEFLVLLGALLLVDDGAQAWAWGYLGYTLLNALGAWLILTHRV